MRASLIAALLHLSAAAVAPTNGKPYLSWVTPTVRPNSTLLASGSGLRSGCRVEINATASGASLLLEPAMVSEQAIMATLPADVPLGIYTLRVLCGDADGASNALSINEPRILWSQGNCGNESTSGGTVRVLGTAISLSSDNKCQQTVRRQQRDAEVALRSGDFERVFGF